MVFLQLIVVCFDVILWALILAFLPLLAIFFYPLDNFGGVEGKVGDGVCD